jgi:hypothetical protein
MEISAMPRGMLSAREGTAAGSVARKAASMDSKAVVEAEDTTGVADNFSETPDRENGAIGG